MGHVAGLRETVNLTFRGWGCLACPDPGVVWLGGKGKEERAQGSPRRRQAPVGKPMEGSTVGVQAVMEWQLFQRGMLGWSRLRREHLETAMRLELGLGVGPVYFSCTISTAGGWRRGLQVRCVCVNSQSLGEQGRSRVC